MQTLQAPRFAVSSDGALGAAQRRWLHHGFRTRDPGSVAGDGSALLPTGHAEVPVLHLYYMNGISDLKTAHPSSTAESPSILSVFLTTPPNPTSATLGDLPR